MGKVIAVCMSKKKGIPKEAIGEAFLKENWGMEGDAHAGGGIRQISMLAQESIDKMKTKGLDVGPGRFAENITTQGIDLVSSDIGTKILLGNNVLLEISKIGKECHIPCAIYYQAGYCIMPREGIFCKVIKGGSIKNGDEIKIL